MTIGCAETNKKWVEIGRSTSTPTDNTQRKEVHLDDYYVVVGFEVNKPEAFVENTHDLAKDYGHAFYYLVKNKMIVRVLSFGPGPALGKVGWFNSQNPTTIKDGYITSRPGNADFPITETVSAFKIPLTAKQGVMLQNETDKFRARVDSGKERYTVYLNDTCAETARDVLEVAEVKTPTGSGKIKNTDFLSFSLVYAVNPYMWHANFVKDGYTQKKLAIPEETEWLPPVDEADPIFGDSE